MTQWSDGQPPGAGPPSYGPPLGSGYPPPGGAPYGSPYGPGVRPQRETGALVVCIVLLVLALIAALVASAAAHANLTDDSAATPRIAVPGGAGGAAAGGGAAGGGAGGASPSPTDPYAQRHRIERNFPVYPGAQRIGSPKRYLADGQIVEKQGRHYFANRSVNAVYHWYRRHIARDHLRFGYVARTFYEGTNRLAYLFGSVVYPNGSLGTGTAEFDLQPGRRRGTCVVSVNFYD